MKTVKRMHYGYVIVMCCCLMMGVNVGIVMSCAGIFYQPVSHDLGVSVGTFGIYMSFNFLFSMLTLPLAGRLIERHSARMLLTVSSCVMGLTLISMSQFNAVWQFYVAGGVLGATLAFLLYLSFPTLINRWFRSRVGFLIGVCSAASGIGGILFNPVGAWLITSFGWRATYAIFGAFILLIVSPVFLLFLRDQPADKGLEPFVDERRAARARVKSSDGVEYSKAVKMPVFYALVFFAFLIMAASTLNLFIPKYVTDLNYTLKQASLTASAVMLGVTVGKVALGMINDRNSVLGVLTTVVLGSGGLLLLIAGHIGFAVVLAGGFLFGWAYAGVTVQTPMLVRAVFGSRNYAQIYSIVSIAFAAGGALTSGAWGVIAEHTSYPFVMTMGISFLIVCGIIGLWALKGEKR